ncbi:trans-acting enoyl reductase family protein [Actinoplanes sp. TFC3]|uniref:saccharopine dehydrogenase family protein n=1 Tax=Actinoplanes sp. TFC3 TaxID=1710355 RepID=UPI0009EA61C7|nr:saccharopine dehydrogenase NADP-binding domain-containing protein [Actinoplanes sp. TFC3]
MRDHDIVIYGATGFAGALVAEHLAHHAPAGTRVALAGRNPDRLAATRAKLGAAAPAAAGWPIVIAEAGDTAALSRLAASTKVVISTAGPFVKYGQALVHACAEAGTHYADLTGEVLFVRRSIDENHALAAKTGARIVHSCGFDSIPSDIGVHLLHAAAREAGAGDLTDTTLVVTSLRGGFSGGTIDSMRNQLDEVRADQAARRIAASPYSLTPDLAAEPDLGRQPDLVTLDAKDVNPRLRGTLAPFVMASYNTRVVRRSNALLGYAYGRTLRYRETMSTGTSPFSPLLATALKLGTGAMFAGLSFPPTRALLDRVLPKRAGEARAAVRYRCLPHAVGCPRFSRTVGHHFPCTVGHPGVDSGHPQGLEAVEGHDELGSQGAGEPRHHPGRGCADRRRRRRAGPLPAGHQERCRLHRHLEG